MPKNRKKPAGRPRKEGARYPSGQLKAKHKNEPNAKVLEIRKALVGGGEKVDLSKADNPVDLAYQRGWFSEAQHRAAMTVARVYRGARIGGPGLDLQTRHEVEEGVRASDRGFANMSDAEVAEIFDAVFCDEGTGPDLETRTEASHELWNDLMRGLSGPEQAELFAVCVEGSWPQWVIWKAAGKEVPDSWDVRRVRLERALLHVTNVLKRRRVERLAREGLAEAAAMKDRPRYTGPKVEETLVYLDENENPDPVLNRAGQPVEVVRRRRA